MGCGNLILYDIPQVILLVWFVDMGYRYVQSNYLLKKCTEFFAHVLFLMISTILLECCFFAARYLCNILLLFLVHINLIDAMFNLYIYIYGHFSGNCVSSIPRQC